MASFRHLRIGRNAVEKLAAHAMTPEDAEGTWDGQPKFFVQNRRWESQSGGGERWRPKRVLMIGPGPTGAMLTFVLEYPDEDGTMFLITGWPSDLAEQRKYRLPGGRGRTR